MAIVILDAQLPGGSGSAFFSVGDSSFAHDSFLLRTDATVTADSEDAGQGIENGFSWVTYGGGWQTSAIGDHEITVGFPQAEEGSCYALHKHNLADLGITVQLETSPDADVWTLVTGSDTSPTNNKTIFFVMDPSETHKFWRLKFTGHTSGTLRIAQIFIGPSFKTTQGPNIGWSPPNLALNDDFITSRADGGDFLGRSLIRRGSKTAANFPSVPETFVRTFWEPFMQAAEEHPFYYSWDGVNFPNEVAYCYTVGKIDIPRYSSHKHFDVTISFIALQL